MTTNHTGSTQRGVESAANASASASPRRRGPRVSSGPIAAPKPAPGTSTVPLAKIDLLVEMLGRPGGATIADLSKQTGWLVHSVRGAISGNLKKQRGLTVISDKVDGVRTYRIATPVFATAPKGMR